MISASRKEELERDTACGSLLLDEEAGGRGQNRTVVNLECQCGSRVAPVFMGMGFNDKKLRRLRRLRLFGRAKVYLTVHWPQLVGVS